MKLVPFIVSLGLTIGLIYFLSNPLSLGDKNIPPIGSLVNPHTGFWQNAKMPDIIPDSNLDFQELNAPVNVHFDERLVPHIFAEDIGDAIFVQGYVTAAHRLFQMDLSTRAAAGRLSEILGDRVLERDDWMRRKGMVFAAENAVEAWKEDAESFALLEKYCAGVNRYIKTLSPPEYPLEYKLIGTEPEPWTPLKTALFVKTMAASLAERHLDVQATNALAKFGKDTFDYLYPEYFPSQSPIIPESVEWDFEPINVPDDSTDNDYITRYDYEDYERTPENIGSNNWAVAGSKTRSGNPILCGDPHLALSLPSIWYEIQIKTPELNAYGVSLPGLPFVIIGFNENIAWSQTNVGHDVADLYRIKWKDETKSEYLLDGKWIKAELKEEVFKIKGKPDVVRTVKYTHWGPVLFEAKEGLDKDLAYQWLAHTASDKGELKVFLNLNKARNYDDYAAALEGYNVPAQNFAFASKDGDIALKVQGQFPLKEEGQGRFIRNGTLTSSGWKGFVPKAHNPMVKNPERGFVASANQHSTDEKYPYYYNREKFESFRGRVLNRYLEKMNDITPQDMMDLHNSNLDMKAEAALPLLLSHLDKRSKDLHPTIIKGLEAWNYSYDMDSRAATFFEVWWNHVVRNIWDETLKENVPTLTPNFIRTISLIRDEPASGFFDKQSTPKKETIVQIITEAFLSTTEEVGEEFEAIPIWLDKKGSAITHLARIPAFSANDVKIGGVYSALNAMTATNGPSWRQVVELGDKVKAHVSYPGGQSGNPASAHYDDFIETWASGKYYIANFMYSENDSAKEGWESRTFSNR